MGKVYWMIEPKKNPQQRCLGLLRGVFRMTQFSNFCALKFKLKEDADRFLSENIGRNDLLHVVEHIFLS